MPQPTPKIRVVKRPQRYWYGIEIDGQVYEIYYDETEQKHTCASTCYLWEWEEACWLELLVVQGVSREEILPIALVVHKQAGEDWAKIVQQTTESLEAKKKLGRR